MPRTSGHYIPLLVTVPGFGWINAYMVASEIGDIERFASPAKLCGQVSRRYRFRVGCGVCRVSSGGLKTIS